MPSSISFTRGSFHHLGRVPGRKSLTGEFALDGSKVDHETLDQRAAERAGAKCAGQFALETNTPAL